MTKTPKPLIGQFFHCLAVPARVGAASGKSPRPSRSAYSARPAQLAEGCFSSRSWMSRRAVSCEHLANLAHLAVVRLPSKPSSSLLVTSRWRRLKAVWACRCQNLALSLHLGQYSMSPGARRAGSPGTTTAIQLPRCRLAGRAPTSHNKGCALI